MSFVTTFSPPLKRLTAVTFKLTLRLRFVFTPMLLKQLSNDFDLHYILLFKKYAELVKISPFDKAKLLPYFILFLSLLLDTCVKLFS